jgi:hypothetical protein
MLHVSSFEPVMVPLVRMSDAGKLLIMLGALLALVGSLLWFGGKIPGLGRLPGDIRIEREHFRFYFPLATCLLISAVVSLVLWLLRRR